MQLTISICQSESAGSVQLLTADFQALQIKDSKRKIPGYIPDLDKVWVPNEKPGQFFWKKRVISICQLSQKYIVSF